MTANYCTNFQTFIQTSESESHCFCGTCLRPTNTGACRNSSKMDQSVYTSSTSSSSLPPSLHSSPPLPFPPALSTLPFLLCCEVDLLTTAGSLGEHCKLPQCGLEHCKLPSGVWSRARTVRCPVGSEHSLHCKLPQRGLEQSSGCNRNKGIF